MLARRRRPADATNPAQQGNPVTPRATPVAHVCTATAALGLLLLVVAVVKRTALRSPGTDGDVGADIAALFGLFLLFVSAGLGIALRASRKDR